MMTFKNGFIEVTKYLGYMFLALSIIGIAISDVLLYQPIWFLINGILLLSVSTINKNMNEIVLKMEKTNDRSK